jgi:beta-lactamase class A
MVAKSDNTAVETLFRVGGGAPTMAARFRQWNVTGLRVDRGERQINLDRNGIHHPPATEWTDELIVAPYAKAPMDKRYRATLRSLHDPRDTGTPAGTVRLFDRLYRGEALSKASTALLVENLKATTTFPTRLKGLLPAGTVVAHKTGTTETVKGLTTATNDSGVIFLPSGALLAVSVYVKASTRNAETRDRIIANIARATFDYYS